VFVFDRYYSCYLLRIFPNLHPFIYSLAPLFVPLPHDVITPDIHVSSIAGLGSARLLSLLKTAKKSYFT